MFGRFHDIAASERRALDLRGEADQTNLARPTLKRIDLYVIRWVRRKFKWLRRKTKGLRLKHLG